MSVAADFDANTAGWDAEQLSSSDDDGAAAAASTSASGMPGSSTDAYDDLYGGLDGATALPSTLELRRQLDEATAERRALEAEEAELRRKFETGKAAVNRLALTASSEHALLGGCMIKLMRTADWVRLGADSFFDMRCVARA